MVKEGFWERRVLRPFQSSGKTWGPDFAVLWVCDFSFVPSFSLLMDTLLNSKLASAIHMPVETKHGYYVKSKWHPSYCFPCPFCKFPTQGPTQHSPHARVLIRHEAKACMTQAPCPYLSQLNSEFLMPTTKWRAGRARKSVMENFHHSHLPYFRSHGDLILKI